MVVKTRRFDNKIYRFHGDYPKKSDAKRAARFRREDGLLARVVKGEDGWAVFVRRK